jgi:hypothetical protein
MFLDANDSFGTTVYPDPLKPGGEEQVIFPGSSRMAEAFGDAIAALLETCGCVANSGHNARCVFKPHWRIIFEFLLANGSTPPFSSSRTSTSSTISFTDEVLRVVS